MLRPAVAVVEGPGEAPCRCGRRVPRRLPLPRLPGRVFGDGGGRVKDWDRSGDRVAPGVAAPVGDGGWTGEKMAAMSAACGPSLSREGVGVGGCVGVNM